MGLLGCFGEKWKLDSCDSDFGVVGGDFFCEEILYIKELFLRIIVELIEVDWWCCMVVELGVEDGVGGRWFIFFRF